MAQKLTKVAETTTLANTDTLIVVDESAQNTDGSTGALKRIPKSSTGFALPSDITSAINTEVSNRNTAITNAINTEVTNRNNAIESAVEEAKSEIDDLKASKDGRYDELTAGTAEDLITDVDFSDTDTYLFRKSPAKYNRARIDEIVGGSIVWNQLQPLNGLPATQTITGVTLTNNGDGSVTLSGTNTGSSSAIFSCTTFPNTIPVGHKVLLTGASGMNWGGPFTVYDSGTGSLSAVKTSEGIVYNKTGTYTRLDIAVWAGSTVNVRFSPIVCDLTQMFGSQIADYIYSLEQAQSGKGVEFFKSLFPNDYYPYNAGELLSVEGLQSHDTVGFNQWDEEWESGDINITNGEKRADSTRIRSKNFIKVLPNTTYYAYYGGGSNNGLYICYYDGDKNWVSADRHVGWDYIDNATFTTPSWCQYIMFYNNGTTYKNDICINLSWSGWRNGEYEPYKKHSYPLDSSLTLRGVLKLNAQNELYFNGDIYSHDGKVGRRFSTELDLGSLTWSRSPNSGVYYFVANLPKPTAFTYSTPLADMNVNYFGYAYKGTSGWAYMGNKTFGFTWNDIRIRDDSYTDASAFKTAMSGVMLVYELKTPTTEEAEPFNNIQITLKDGTEQYISSSIVPPYSTTYYLESLEHKIKKDSAIIKSASGSVASFKDGGEDMPLKGLNVNIVPKQSGSGDPSPDNVRPISGWDTVEVYVGRKNILPKMTAGTYSANGGTIVVDNDGVAHLSGTTTASGNVAIIPLETPITITQDMVDKGLYYHLRNSEINANISPSLENNSAVSLWAVAFSPLNRIFGPAGSGSIGKTVTRIRFYVSSGVTLSGTYAPSLEFTNEATAYEPYNGTSYPISLGQTVYGGTLEVMSGKLVIDKAMVDLGSLDWNYLSSNNPPIFYKSIPTKALGTSNIVCEKYKTDYYTNSDTIWGNSSSAVVYINDPDYTDVQSFKASLNGIKAVYELETPTEITLTPTQVTTLLGNNNIFADSGSVEVEYRADTTLAYNELLSLIASLS